ncbi:hypothetical protein BH18ACT14_BH18ACT14_03220 [soil metagenome]
MRRAPRTTFSRVGLARDHTVQPRVSGQIDISHVAYLDNHVGRRYPLVCLRIRQRRRQCGQAQLAAAGPPRVPGRRVARARLDLACERAGVAALQLRRGPVRRGSAPGSRCRRVRGRACARTCGGERHVRRDGARRRPHGHDSNARRPVGDAPPSRNHHRGQGCFRRRGRTGGHVRVERGERVGPALRTPGDSPGFGRRRLPGSRELSTTPGLGPRDRRGSRGRR